MRLGFTGTREGLTTPQRDRLGEWFASGAEFHEFHHGCCYGADADAVGMIVGCGVRVHAHPSNLPPRFTDAVAIQVSDVVNEVLPPLERNRVIVDSCDVLLACPKGPEERRSGTWACVRYGRKVGRRIVIVWPDGTVTEEGGRG